MRTISLFLLLLLSTPVSGAREPSPLERALAHESLAPVVADARRFKLQVVLGLIDDTNRRAPRLVQHEFRNDAEYFYPASSVKLCAAIAALEFLTDLRRETGLDISPDTPLIYHPLFDDEQLDDQDPSNVESRRITVRHEIRKLFLVSDNRAYNRLYELVGQRRLNESMWRAGIDSARIVHRLSEYRTPDQNRMSPRIDFLGDGWRHQLPQRISEPPIPPRPNEGLLVGKGSLTREGLVEQPMDFSDNNAITLADLQRTLCKTVRPDIECEGDRFRLDDDHYDLLIDAMTQYPARSENPVYDPDRYPDHHVKWFLPGLERVVPREHVRIANKVGRAYGFSTENAYVRNTRTGRSFFLAAVLYTNEDGILNDDRYEYDEVADPLLADLAESVARVLWTAD